MFYTTTTISLRTRVRVKEILRLNVLATSCSLYSRHIRENESQYVVFRLLLWYIFSYIFYYVNFVKWLTRLDILLPFNFLVSLHGSVILHDSFHRSSRSLGSHVGCWRLTCLPFSKVLLRCHQGCCYFVTLKIYGFLQVQASSPSPCDWHLEIVKWKKNGNWNTFRLRDCFFW